MRPWIVEYGTLWAWEAGNGLPPPCPAQVEVEFGEVGIADIDDLLVAMNLPTTEPIQQRLQSNRRCFSLRTAGQIVSYGWVTHGVEEVGELDRQFHFYDDEAYIWDCGTVPSRRNQGCYSALLNQLIYHLHAEGVARIWIGASRQNRPSIRGFARAGFKPVIDCTYRRFYRLTLLRFQEFPAAHPPLISAAYRVLLNNHEQRLGKLAIGFK
jgi:ribosomal protein S18 acetylase RimI-like enzyme